MKKLLSLLVVLAMVAMMGVAYGANWCRDRYVPAKG